MAISRNLNLQLLVASVGFLFVSASSLGLANTIEDIAAIKNNLEMRQPPIKPKSIKLSPLTGLYEVYISGNIFYVDKTVSYLITGGSLLDNVSKKNLTAERLIELTSINFSDLPLKDAIAIKKGSGAYKFAVFSDPDCPYCKTLEQGLDKIGASDYTAYMFLYPLKELHPDATAKAESIWCSKDKQNAWLNWMINGTVPEKRSCDNPIESNKKLADDLGVSGTPTIYLNDGKRAQNPKDLIAAIEENK